MDGKKLLNTIVSITDLAIWSFRKSINIYPFFYIFSWKLPKRWQDLEISCMGSNCWVSIFSIYRFLLLLSDARYLLSFLILSFHLVRLFSIFKFPSIPHIGSCFRVSFLGFYRFLLLRFGRPLSALILDFEFPSRAFMESCSCVSDSQHLLLVLALVFPTPTASMFLEFPPLAS